MSTSSTKSGSNKRTRTGNRATEADQETVAEFPDRAWRIGVILILLIGGVLRLYDLNLVPLHHDEGVNGNFLVRLVREGVYKYDPENYHGPTLYYFSALIPWLSKLLFGAGARDAYGLTTFTIRLVPALFGMLTIGLVLLLRRRLGTLATLSAGLLLAVSPGAVYLSRYFIHETLFVFFTLAIVVAVVRFYDDRNPSYLLAAAASFALMLATKETALISIGVLVIALALTFAYQQLNRKNFGQTGGKRNRELRISEKLRLVSDEMGGRANLVVSAVLALVVFQVLYLLFYSSFLTNYEGISASLQTFAVWSKTGKIAHVHPATMYVSWLVSQESPLLFLGAIGSAIVVLRPKNAFALFSSLWAFGLLAAYSLIPYKTPWLLLNFVVPLALIAGYAIQAIYDLDQRQVRLAAVVLLVAIGFSTFQSIDLNFINYDNDDSKYVYVYAHTKRGMLDLVNQIEQIAKENSGELTGITIVSPDYWPLPWYLRNYTRVGYFARMAASSEPMIIANENQKPEMEANFGSLYRQVSSNEPGGAFELRPGVKLLLYLRRTGSAPEKNSPAVLRQ